MYNNKPSFICPCTFDKCSFVFLAVIQLLLIFKFCSQFFFFSVFIKICVESNFSNVLKLLVINFDSYCNAFAKTFFFDKQSKEYN